MNQNNEPHRAANHYIQSQEQQHHQQFYQATPATDTSRNGATQNHIPLATMNNHQSYVPYQSNNNNLPTAPNYQYQSDQYQQQRQQPRLKLKKDT